MFPMSGVFWAFSTNGCSGPPGAPNDSRRSLTTAVAAVDLLRQMTLIGKGFLQEISWNASLFGGFYKNKGKPHFFLVGGVFLSRCFTFFWGRGIADVFLGPQISSGIRLALVVRTIVLLVIRWRTKAITRNLSSQILVNS